MIQVAYVSRAPRSLASDEVFRIIETSASNNLRDDLTGFLIFFDHRFFQVVEGPEASIDALLLRLGKDQRHSDIQVLSREVITRRSFPKWRMKRIKPNGQILAAIDSSFGAGVIPLHLNQAVVNFLKSSESSGALV